jgi:hypothetical protein
VKAIVQAVARAKLPLYNKTWRGERPELTADQFAAKLKPSSVDVSRRRTTLYFNDGGLLLDHVIEVRLSPAGAVKEVLLAG